MPLTKNTLLAIADLIKTQRTESEDVQRRLDLFRAEARLRAEADKQARVQQLQAMSMSLGIRRTRASKAA